MKDEASQRLQQAVQAYEEAEGALSITLAAWLHAVSKTTLYNRVNGRRDQVSYITLKQPRRRNFFKVGCNNFNLGDSRLE